MGTAAIQPEERIGLLLAVALHAGLLAVLVMHPGGKPPPVPERIAVTISDEVGLTATAPQARAEAAPDVAPTLGEPAPAPSPLPVARPEPVAKPEPVVKPLPKVQPKPEPKPVAKPLPAPKPAPVTRTPPAPAKPTSLSRNRPDPIAEALAAARTAKPAKTARPSEAAGVAKAAKPVRQAGASRIGDDFLKGESTPQSAGKAAVAAPTISAEEKAGLSNAIARRLKPHWVAPQGADAEQLVTILAWNLNADGTLDGTPRLVRQEGITESNRPQAPRHVEQAIRAVQLSAPFDLPPNLYPAWKRVAAFRFDRKLSQ